jgi:hypothetical protein
MDTNDGRKMLDACTVELEKAQEQMQGLTRRVSKSGRWLPSSRREESASRSPLPRPPPSSTPPAPAASPAPAVTPPVARTTLDSFDIDVEFCP